MLYQSPRTFAIWDFHPTLSQLLIRSSMDPGTGLTYNIDLIAGGVFYVDIPMAMTGIAIDLASHSETERLAQKCGLLVMNNEERFYSVRTESRTFFIGAAMILVEENALDLLETSLISSHKWRIDAPEPETRRSL
jgi:hypothetical protein